LTVCTLNPLEDPRWAEFVQRHPRASVFHTPGWLEALHRTYGYEPIVYTTSLPRAELTNGLVFCRVRSWLTGNRIVSLPFSDHCEALADKAEDLNCLLDSLERESKSDGWKYVEMRPVSPLLEDRGGFRTDRVFHFHKIDLRPQLSELFRSFAKTGCQQKIRRAERMKLTYEEGRSELLLKKFYGLLLMTRRRQHLPPQPMEWFQNLMYCLGEKLQIRVVSKDSVPIASLLTLAHRESIVDKYGCSDERFHNLGGIPFLFWKTIQEAKDLGLSEFDLGRSDPDARALISFKEGWHATRSTLTYYRCPPCPSECPAEGWKIRLAKRVFARLPDPVLTTMGKLLYRHIG
jgi:GNAT acetyltransferase-like protein